MAKYLGIPLQVANGTTVTPTYGSPELVVDGGFPTGTTAWSKGSDTTLGSNEASFDGTSSYVYQNILVVGKVYECSVRVKTWVSGAALSVGSASTGGGTVYKEITKADNTTTTFTFRAVTATLGIGSRSFDVEGSIDLVSVKEVPYVLGDNQVVDGTFSSLYAWEGTNVGWSTLEGQAIHSGAGGDIKQELNLVVGKTYQATATMDFTGDATINNSSFQIRKNNNSGSWVQLSGSPALTPNAKKTYTLTFVAEETNPFIRFYSEDELKVSNVLLQEVQYNYLQVVGGDLLKQCKVGDVVFNPTDDTEAVVLQVISNDVLLLSNDILSDAGVQFYIFAPNGDTRGNQLLRIDNYIISEYDESVSAPSQSSFWFAAGPQADKVTLTHLKGAVNTYFVADVIERFVQRLNAQSATASRLDIPLNEFRDHKYNQVLATAFIILS